MAPGNRNEFMKRIRSEATNKSVRLFAAAHKKTAAPDMRVRDAVFGNSADRHSSGPLYCTGRTGVLPIVQPPVLG